MTDHEVFVALRRDGTADVRVNGRPVKCAWMNVHSSVKSRTTAVTMEVIMEPMVVARGDVRRFTWTLDPARFVGELPPRWFEPRP